ncbi:MAG: AAA-like domain-containing protein [Desulfococcaceae bacterium]
MRKFHSYGPVDCRHHFCVERRELIQRCFEQMIGIPEECGHFFTIWSPRQCGKTWLMRQVKKEIEKQYPDRFIIGMMSVQGVIMEKDDPDAVLFRQLPRIVRDAFRTEPPPPKTWDDWIDWFSKDKGLFDKPLILFIDEFDSLPSKMIDRLVTLFRDMYLKRESFNIHGLALIGVRAVLGVESLRGSPFNIQRSLHVPNFTKEEVEDLFCQYQTESGQKIDPDVAESVYDSTRGQPGLVCWFGELLTEKYNPGAGKVIDISTWKNVYEAALHTEWNNTVLNLVKKVKSGYQEHALSLFARSDIPFSVDADWCAYLYLNGVISMQTQTDERGKITTVCRFSCPFIQQRLYNALTYDLIGDRLPILAIEPLDTLSDVFDVPEINVPALLERYKNYLKRLKARGINPWKDQPRRSDLHYTEYAGHFHLYFWLQNAVGRQCGISPEFPTGNGRVDLHLRCKDRQAVIEVKSFRDQAELRHSREQAAAYACKLHLPAVTLAVFVPVEDEDVLKQLSGETVIDGVTVTVTAIGWV